MPNPTLMAITREILLRNIDQKANHSLAVKDLNPLDSTLFMKAYTDSGLFNEVILFESIESHFITRIDEADGPCLVTMFGAHASWMNNMVEECLKNKKQDHKVFKTFAKYSEAFSEKLIVNIIRNTDSINLKGAMLTLVNGNLMHIKRRDNIRLMRNFATIVI